MTYIDLHAHLDFFSEEKISEIIKKSSNVGVKKILANGVDLESNKKILQISEKHPEVFPCLGVYPVEGVEMSEEMFKENMDFIRKNKDKIYAIGEVGLDLKEIPKLEKQIENFEKVINLSKEINKPLIVHCRKAEKEVIDLLEKKQTKKVVLHCFMGKLRHLQKIRDRGWYLTIPTCVKNSEHFQKIIEKFPLNQLFCETDSPFLHPDKKPNNTPENVIESYKKIAEIKSIPIEKVEKQIEDNFKELFC